ncbi:MAG: hypothetical protein DMG67_14245, partial [Acidobacteria bacterium]
MKRTLLLHFVLLLSTLVCSLGQGPETQNAEVPRRATLTGRVLNAASGEPVKKAHLALSKAESAGSTDADDSSAPEFAATSNAEGYFIFEHVRLAAQRNGFVGTEYGAPGADRAGTVITLAADQKFDLTLKMVPLGVIAGRVLDADGDAVSGATISAIRVFFANGKRQIERLSRMRSNDLGDYRLYDLPPGRYYLAAAIASSAPEDSQPADDDSGLIYYQ